MEKEIGKYEDLEQVQQKIKEWLMVLDKVYYVKMTMWINVNKVDTKRADT
ncbi:hypothetical protein [Enterococcus faecalis]|nr:hypothetical protein [Enterococcus faecalis]